MQCKEGELAFIVKSLIIKNRMKIVTVKEYIGRFERNEFFEYRGESYRVPETDDYWWIETPPGGTPLVAAYGPDEFVEIQRAFSPDSWLKPIRPEDLNGESEDETLGLEHTNTVDA